MNKKLFLSLSLLTAVYASAENDFYVEKPFINIPAIVRGFFGKSAKQVAQPIVEQPVVEAVQETVVEPIVEQSVVEQINPKYALPEYNDNAYCAQGKALMLAGLSAAKNAGSKAYAFLNQSDKTQEIQNALSALKANTWDRSITFKGTEYKNAGKYATAGTGFMIATALAYKYGLFGKTKNAAQSTFAKSKNLVKSAYTKAKNFRPFAKKTVEPKIAQAQTVALEPKEVTPAAKTVVVRLVEPKDPQAARGAVRYTQYLQKTKRG